jgi:hypothetical protein
MYSARGQPAADYVHRVTDSGFANRRQHLAGFRHAGGEGLFTQDVATAIRRRKNHLMVESARHGNADDVQVDVAQHGTIVVAGQPMPCSDATRSAFCLGRLTTATTSNSERGFERRHVHGRAKAGADNANPQRAARCGGHC